jgi:hypothetical protein
VFSVVLTVHSTAEQLCSVVLTDSS